MAKVSLSTIKNWFKSTLKPTEQQFSDTWDSFRHKDDVVPAAEVDGLDNLLMGKAESAHLIDLNAHSEIVQTLRDEINNSGLQSSILEITLPIEEAIDPASTSIIERLNESVTPIVVDKLVLVYVRFWVNEISDGDNAFIKQWVCFLLEPGTYGLGNSQIPTDISIINDSTTDGRDFEISTRSVKISEALTLRQADGSSIGTQEKFNRRVGTMLYDVTEMPTFYRHGIKYERYQATTTARTFDFRYEPGETFEVTGNFAVLLDSLTGSGWSTLLELDASKDGTIKRTVIVGYFNNGSNDYDIEVTLQQTIDNSTWTQWQFWTTGQFSLGNIYGFKINVELLDINTNNLRVSFIVNGTTYSIDTATGLSLDPSHVTAGYALQTGAWPFTALASSNRINAQNNHPGSIELNALSATIFGMTEEFFMTPVTERFGNVYKTLQGYTFSVSSNQPIDRGSGELFHRDNFGQLRPVKIESLRDSYRVSDLKSVFIENTAGYLFIPNTVALFVTNGWAVMNTEDTLEYDGGGTGNTLPFYQLTTVYRQGLTADVVFPGFNFDNGEKCEIILSANGLLSVRLLNTTFDTFVGGEGVLFRIQWLLI